LEWALPKRRFALGLIWYALVQSFQLSWMSSTHYMGPLILIVYVLLLIALGVQFGLLTWLIGSASGLTVRRCAALAGVWVLFERMRLLPFTGFTWNPAGLALTTSSFSMQAASLFGIFGLSFWVIFVNLLCLRSFQMRTRKSIFVWGLCAIFPFVFGLVQMSIVPQTNGKLSALLVQTSLLPEQRDYDPAHPERFIDPIRQWERIITLIEDAKAKPLDLIVLPEGALPFEAFHCVYPLARVQKIWIDHFGLSQNDFPPLDQFTGFSASCSLDGKEQKVSNAFIVQALSNHFHCEVIVGMDARERRKGGHFNAAFHFSPNRNSASRTEKRILVPIGEYLPFKDSRWFSHFISRQFGVGDSFDPGDDAKIFIGRVPMGVSICYEETYSELIRELRTRGALLFVNITNDVWFPESRLARQHFDHGMIRAIENGLPLIRACNTGITAGVDCFGRIVALQPENQAGALFLQVPLNHFSTLYSLVGDWAILSLSAIFAVAWLKKRFLPEIK
jgi:apolipoprotein N-acyltransferase